MKVLLLEDDPILSDIMYDHLDDKAYNVILCSNGEEALECIDETNFDLFIFDINVPMKNGIEVLQTARDYQKNTPTILITAYQDIEHLKNGFVAGCDDYIKKPFELEELDHRIENIKRKFNIEVDQSIKIGQNISFDFEKHTLKKEGHLHKLSQKECQILNYFLNNQKRVISNDELIQNIWEFDEMPSNATLRVYIKNLRVILGHDKIQTIRGLGYSFE
ncbi:MAG: response regulator transcription factor [Epsilonproteobacteria bacterium]|nr:response regulator transcription factor [Campylobacterota bacterium]